MDKTLLLAMLAQQAPQLLQGLTQRNGVPPIINLPKGMGNRLVYGPDDPDDPYSPYKTGFGYPDEAYVEKGGLIQNIVQPNPDGFDMSPDNPELGFDPKLVALLQKYNGKY